MDLSMRLAVCSTLLLLFAEDWLSCGTGWARQTGEYKIAIKTLESCPDSHKYQLHYGSRLSKYNRTTFTYTYPIDLPVDFDDTWAAEFNIAVFGNGGFKNNFYNVRFDNFCSFLEKAIPEEIARLVENMKLERFCPIKAGKYYIKDYVVKLGKINGFPKFPLGTYRIELISSKKDENGTEVLMGCFRFIVDAIPKNM